MVEVDGILTPIYMFPGMAGVVSRCPDRGCGPIRTQNGWEWWTAFADGYEGYMPMGGQYAGGGRWSWRTQQERNRRPERRKPTLKNVSKAESKRRQAERKRQGIQTNQRTEEDYVATNPNRFFFVFRKYDEKDLVDKLEEIVKYAYNDECTKAFQAAGVTPITEQIQNTTIVTESVFNSAKSDSFWTRGSNVGNEMRDAFYPETNDLAWPGVYRDTGWRFIGLTNRAIEGRDDYLSVVMIHSLVHSGGMPGKSDRGWSEWFWGINPHDLRYLGDKYRDILKYCTREGRSKALGQ
jgi:hypothetical protein